MRATTRKTSPENKHCVIVSICDCPILFAFYNVGKVRYNWIGERAVKLSTENKDLRLYAQVVNKTVNMVLGVQEMTTSTATTAP